MKGRCLEKRRGEEEGGGVVLNGTNYKARAPALGLIHRAPFVVQFLFCLVFLCCSAGALACSRVARVSARPQALLALREQSRALGRQSSRAPLRRVRWQGPEGEREEAPQERQAPPTVGGATAGWGCRGDGFGGTGGC